MIVPSKLARGPYGNTEKGKKAAIRDIRAMRRAARSCGLTNVEYALAVNAAHEKLWVVRNEVAENPFAGTCNIVDGPYYSEKRASQRIKEMVDTIPEFYNYDEYVVREIVIKVFRKKKSDAEIADRAGEVTEKTTEDFYIHEFFVVRKEGKKDSDAVPVIEGGMIMFDESDVEVVSAGYQLDWEADNKMRELLQTPENIPEGKVLKVRLDEFGTHFFYVVAEYPSSD